MFPIREGGSSSQMDSASFPAPHPSGSCHLSKAYYSLPQSQALPSQPLDTPHPGAPREVSAPGMMH